MVCPCGTLFFRRPDGKSDFFGKRRPICVYADTDGASYTEWLQQKILSAQIPTGSSAVTVLQ